MQIFNQYGKVTADVIKSVMMITLLRLLPERRQVGVQPKSRLRKPFFSYGSVRIS